MNPLLYIKYGAIALVVAWVGYYVIDYQNTKEQNIALTKNLKEQKEQTEISNANAAYIGNEYGILQKEQDDERKQWTKQLRKQAHDDAQTASINFADPYASLAVNNRLCNAFSKADPSISCADNQTMPKTNTPDFTKGEWFCFDRKNTNSLVGNVQRMGDYIFVNEGYQ